MSYNDTPSDGFEPWPDINRAYIMEFLLRKYPTKPTVAQMFQSAIVQKLTNAKIAWEDLGVFDQAEQEKLELEVDKLITQLQR